MGLCPAWWPSSEYTWRPLLTITKSKSSVIPFLVSRSKALLTPTARVPCINDAIIGERKLGRKVNLAPDKIPLGGKSPRKCICSVLAQKMAKHRAKFGWPPLSDVGAVTKPRCETRWNLLGCPKLANLSQLLVGQSSPYYEDMWRRYCCLTGFSIVDMCLSASCVQYISDLHSKFALRPHEWKCGRHPICDCWE